jgi:hypothetical protein
MFKPSMAELGLCIYQLEQCVAEQLPVLAAHFAAQGFATSMYASSWFLTIFTTTLSLGVSSRVMDLFLMDGLEVVFRLALALLHLARPQLLQLDMEGMLKYLQKELPPKIDQDPSILFSLLESEPSGASSTSGGCLVPKYNAKRMKKLEKEYAVLKAKEAEEMVELRRLRTENKLLKYRLETLEAESGELAQKLIQGQVWRAEEVETSFSLKRELAGVRQHYLAAMEQLEQQTKNYQHILMVLEENKNRKAASLDEISLKSELLKQNEELLHCLQGELVEVRLREAENAVVVADLRGQIRELEEEKKRLRECVVDNSVAHLQEELIAVKLREAEASLSLKELRQTVLELNSAYQRHLAENEEAESLAEASGGGNSGSGPPSLTKSGVVSAIPGGGPSGAFGSLLFTSGGSGSSARAEIQRLEEEAMSLRLREMNTIIEVKEARLRIMELETAVQVSSNQLRRQEEESRRLREEIDKAGASNKALLAELGKERRRYNDLESKLKEDSVHARIRYAEKSQQMFDLTQQLSSLRLKNQELLAERIVAGSDSEQAPTATQPPLAAGIGQDPQEQRLVKESTALEGFDDVELSS